MKIGILTLPLHTNYGGILQAYALQTILKSMGHEVAIYDRGKYSRGMLWKFVYLCKLVGKIILKRKKVFINELYNFFIFDSFVKKHMSLRNSNKIQSLYETKDLDLIVVGSDQVWRSCYSPDVAYYYLNFASSWDIKRIAYAASFGEDKWSYSEEETYKCTHLLSLFDAVSVREYSAVSLCHQKLKREVSVVLDPTLLLTKNKYMQLLDDVNCVKSEAILVYMLDWTENKRTLVSHLSVLLGKPWESIGHINGRSISIANWLKGFLSSKYVITDSFHGCVFSIIFNKQFVALGNKSRGETRFLSLLSMLDLSERLVNSEEEVLRIIQKPIDWINVNKKLAIYKEKSFSFLQKHII